MQLGLMQFPLFSNMKHVYDRMLNFLLFKMIFVGAVMDPAWIRLSIWIAILGFLRIFSLLSRDRFDHVRKYQQCPPSTSPSTSPSSPSHAFTHPVSFSLFSFFSSPRCPTSRCINTKRSRCSSAAFLHAMFYGISVVSVCFRQASPFSHWR